jgi:ubiquinone/menaquinone biosynthesis C-methylase UbiE
VFPAEKAQSLLNPLRRIIQSPRRTVARLQLASTARVLEVGPGPGYFSAALVEAVPRGHVVLLDLQPEMLTLARGRVGARASGVSYVCADASRLPLAPATFDAALVVLVLGEIPDRDGCIDELARLVRPGGAAVFAETRRDGDFVALPELRALVEPHGFGFVDRRGFAWEYTARFLRS